MSIKCLKTRKQSSSDLKDDAFAMDAFANLGQELLEIQNFREDLGKDYG